MPKLRYAVKPGDVFERWTVLGRDHSDYWACICQCGTVKVIRSITLAYGTSKSCGCLKREINAVNGAKLLTKHGKSGTRLYQTWLGMISRCTYPSQPGYKHYGGRGITVYPPWREAATFMTWALNHGYEEGLTIERIDVNGHYEPGNITFIPLVQQALNTRRNRLLTAFGETKPAIAWARDARCRIGYRTLLCRLHSNWAAETALTTPALKDKTVG